MAEQTLVGALILGFVEGLTEFIPVSSTGHILLLGHFMGFDSTGKTFEVLIQLGAILAIISVYFYRLLELARTFPTSPETRRFVIGVLVAFLPAAVLGAAGHGIIKDILFESPMLICFMLVIGGFILLYVDRIVRDPEYDDVMQYPLSLCLKIGLFQCLALIPGVSRSGATIAGSLLMGADKRSAAEFSFYLAMPTMAGAFAFDLFQNRSILTMDDIALIAAGFVMAFITALFVVRSLLDYVSRHGFALFAYWRIVVGSIGLLLLAF